MLLPHLAFAHKIWREHLKSRSMVVDATTGNGKDLLILAERVLPCEGKIFALDIQEKALEKAKKFLSSRMPGSEEKITFLHQCHSSLDMIPQEIDLIVYNLGYLPGSDKKIITTKDSTIQSLRQGMQKLAANGAISITCYVGHKDGREEYEVVEKELVSLDPQYWEISKHEWISRPNSPIFFWCKRKPSLTESNA